MIAQNYQYMKELQDSNLGMYNGGFIQDLSLIDNLNQGWDTYQRKRSKTDKTDKLISQFEFDPILKIKAKHLSEDKKSYYFNGINKWSKYFTLRWTVCSIRYINN